MVPSVVDTPPHDSALRLDKRHRQIPARGSGARPRASCQHSVLDTGMPPSGQDGHQGTPGNERADILAGKAAEKLGHSRTVSLAHLKLQIPRSSGRQRQPGGVRVLLANPRWERRFVCFLELSGWGGRWLMERTYTRPRWTSGSRGRPKRWRIVEEMDNLFCPPFFSFHFYFVRGTPAPESCAQRTVEGDGSPMFERTDRRRPLAFLSFVFLWPHIPLG